MITIDEARGIVLRAVRPLPSETVPVADALGRVLTRDVAAAGDVPPFTNSAMDGFALVAGPAGRSLAVVGESRAGRPAERALGDGEAIRISTGAVVPAGADAVVRVEDTAESDGHVVVRAAVVQGENLRAPGEDVHAGEQLLTAGTPLGPAELGVAVSAGLADVPCARRPRVAVLATGDELVEAGAPLAPGQIHNTNGVALSALAAQVGAEVVVRGTVPDDRDATVAALGGALDAADVVLVSGGVSVGPHDHVKPALAGLGVEERFWRVELKPGKPTWFGVRGEQARVRPARQPGVRARDLRALRRPGAARAAGRAGATAAAPRAPLGAGEAARRPRAGGARARRRASRRRPGHAHGRAGLAPAAARCSARARWPWCRPARARPPRPSSSRSLRARSPRRRPRCGRRARCRR